MVFTTGLFELPVSFTESRMNSLYSDFRKIEEGNPEGFAANIAAWKTALLSMLGNCDNFPDRTLINAGPDLVSFFDTLQHGTPLALDTVFDQLVKNKSIVPFPTYMDPKRNPIYSGSTWWSLAKPNPIGIVSWAFQKTGLYDPSWKSAQNNGKTIGTLKREKYVAISALEVVATALVSQIEKDINSSSLIGIVKGATTTSTDPSESSNRLYAMGTPGGYTRSIFTKQMFYATYNRVTIPPKTGPYNQLSNSALEIELSNSDLDVLLVYLSKDMPKLSVKNDVIKLQIHAANNSEISAVTDKDVTYAQLKHTVGKVIQRVNDLSAQIEACDKKARSALASKGSNRQSIAKYAVKSRKMAQSSQDSALDMLGNLEKTLSSLDTAEGNSEAFKALENSVSILNSLQKEIGGVEKVTELMDRLGDEMADTEEIDKQLGSLTASKVDEDDLDEELEAMLKQEKEKASPKTNIPALPELPNVPTTNPKKQSDTEDEELASQLGKITLTN